MHSRLGFGEAATPHQIAMRRVRERMSVGIGWNILRDRVFRNIDAHSVHMVWTEQAVPGEKSADQVKTWSLEWRSGSRYAQRR